MQTIDHVVRYVPPSSFRIEQIRGMFDYSSPCTERKWSVEIPSNDDDWQIGLIVGPSGSGKSQIACRAFDSLGHVHAWKNLPIIDEFPTSMSVREITDILTRVGLSSTPSWTLPYSCLSTGQKFRADIAMAISEVEKEKTIVIDEFTSTVDRTVAKTTSAVVSSTIRKINRRMVAISCHYDIIDWLNPDWILDMTTEKTTRRSLQRRPPIKLDISRCGSDKWRLFMHHHYLSHELWNRARSYIATVENVPAGFIAIIPYPSVKYGLVSRVHRIVVLPDFQGLGIAGVLLREICGRLQNICYISTSHAPFARSLSKSKDWIICRQPSVPSALGKTASANAVRSVITASFRYVGPKYTGHSANGMTENSAG